MWFWHENTLAVTWRRCSTHARGCGQRAAPLWWPYALGSYHGSLARAWPTPSASSRRPARRPSRSKARASNSFTRSPRLRFRHRPLASLRRALPHGRLPRTGPHRGNRSSAQGRRSCARQCRGRRDRTGRHSARSAAAITASYLSDDWYRPGRSATARFSSSTSGWPDLRASRQVCPPLRRCSALIRSAIESYREDIEHAPSLHEEATICRRPAPGSRFKDRRAPKTERCGRPDSCKFHENAKSSGTTSVVPKDNEIIKGFSLCGFVFSNLQLRSG